MKVVVTREGGAVIWLEKTSKMKEETSGEELGLTVLFFLWLTLLIVVLRLNLKGFKAKEQEICEEEDAVEKDADLKDCDDETEMTVLRRGGIMVVKLDSEE